jgi:hypothetical protein
VFSQADKHSTGTTAQHHDDLGVIILALLYQSLISNAITLPIRSHNV